MSAHNKNGDCCCGGSNPGGPGNIGGCICQGTPQILSVTYTPSPGTPAIYPGGSLSFYGTSPGPPYLAGATFPGPAYYSTASWVDGSGIERYYRLSCSASMYLLAIGAKLGGIWQSPDGLYTWTIGGPNTCSPFALTAGQPVQGTTFTGSFTVTESGGGAASPAMAPFGMADADGGMSDGGSDLSGE